MLASFTECRAPISSILMTSSCAFAVKQLIRAAAANSFSVFIYLYFVKIPGQAGDKVLFEEFLSKDCQVLSPVTPDVAAL